MITLALDRDFEGTGWIKRETGSGSATISSGVLTCTAAVGEQGILDYYIPVMPGQRIEVEIEARRVSGEPQILLEAIAHDSTLTVVDFISLDSTDWKRYKLIYDVPVGQTKDFVRLVLGLPTAKSGTGQFFYPTIQLSRGLGNSIVLARGLLSLATGVTGFHASFPYFGIASLAFSTPDTLVVTLKHSLMSAVASRPNVQVSGTQANALIPVVGNITDGAAPTIDIQWSNGTSVGVNVSGIANLFVFFLVTL